MERLLRRVQSRLHIHAHRAVLGLLEGEYRSVFHGRSMDFDDLRPYVPGDEVKDIDWKATARHGSPLIKRYIAARQHTIVLVVDTGRDMAALASSGESKRDIAILAAGTVGYLAIRHGDPVALVAGTSEKTEYVAGGLTESHLERLLQRIQADTTLAGGPSGLAAQLAYVSRVFRHRRIVVVVGDDRELTEGEQKLVRRLAAQHEVLWLSIGDADLMREDWAVRDMYDVADGGAVPAFLRENPRLRAAFQRSVVATAERSDELFESLTISSKRLTALDDVVPGIFRLLRAHRHARR